MSPEPRSQPDAAPDAHLTPETLADYFAQALSNEQELQIEDHLADCETCIDTGRLAFTVSNVFDLWTARAHGQAELRAVLQHALGVASQQTAVAAWRQRLARWADEWAGQAEAAVRIVLEAPGQAAKVLMDGMDELARPGSAWALTAAPAPIPTRGAGRARSSAPIVVTTGGAGGPSARVSVSGERGEIAVRLDGVAPGTEPPLVLLVPTNLDAAPRLGVPELSPGLGDAWIARFTGVGTGDYLVAFEPLA